MKKYKCRDQSWKLTRLDFESCGRGPLKEDLGS